MANSGMVAALVLWLSALLAATREGGLLEHVGPIELAPPLDTRALAPVIAATAAPLLLTGGSDRWTPAWSRRTRTLRAVLAGVGPLVAWFVISAPAGGSEPLAGLAVTASALASVGALAAILTDSILALLAPTCVAAVAFFWRASARTSHGPLGVFFGEEWSLWWVGCAIALAATCVALASVRRPRGAPRALAEPRN